MSDLYQKLENIVSKKYISNNIIVRHAYSRNVDQILQGVPDIVIRPKDAKEISEILKIANEENIAVIPRGGGDCEFGGSKPIGAPLSIEGRTRTRRCGPRTKDRPRSRLSDG